MAIIKLYRKLTTNKYFWRFAQFIYVNVLPTIASIKEAINHYILKKRKKVARPILFIEPTNACNGKCVFCAYPKIKDKKIFMNMDVLKKTIDEFKQIGGTIIDFTPVVGEILVDQNLWEKINYAKQSGLQVQAYTNGILLNVNDNYKKLIDAEFTQLSISLADFDPALDSKIFRIPEKLSSTRIEGICKLIEYAKETGSKTRITLEFRPARAPYKILQTELGKKYRSQVEMNFMLGYDNWGGSITQPELKGIMKLRKPMFVRKNACKRMYENISVLSNGDVRLCGCRAKDTVYDQLVVGNIQQNTLNSILTNTKTKKIRNSFRTGKIPEVCKKCTVYESCVN